MPSVEMILVVKDGKFTNTKMDVAVCTSVESVPVRIFHANILGNVIGCLFYRLVFNHPDMVTHMQCVY